MSKVQTISKFIFLGTGINKLLITFIPGLLALIVGITTGYAFGVKPNFLLGDLADLAGQVNPLYGLFTKIGVWCWFSTAILCLFTATTLRKLKSRQMFNFLMYSGILSTYLGIDDDLMFHDFVAPRYLNIPENYVLAVTLIAFIVYVIKFHKLILNNNYTFFILAISLLGMSLGLDVLIPENFKNINTVRQLNGPGEDIFKFLGIISWLSYFFYYCCDLFTNTLSSAEKPEKV